ncbi:BRCA1-associated RING domain protein 1 [Daucus carota subsp. sativus]|uniref:BRCA1-associated RING domain protein 1 n=1 Tax=Daucus carota subsp. sativus TaxID=79200 RepID=UPI0030835949
MMSENNDERVLNPWLLHLHKLSLALKCPICMELLDEPVLLPCDHLLCNSCICKQSKKGSKCPACQTNYVGRDTRSAFFMENVIAVFKSLCSTSLADTCHPLASDVAKLSEKSPASAITNQEILEESVETFAEENSINGKSMSSLKGSKTHAQICLKGDTSGRKEDRSLQSQPPGHLKNGNLIKIAVKTVKMNQKRLSVGRTRSLREIYKDAKRQKILKSPEAYNDECGYCHTFEVEKGQILRHENRELVPGDASSSRINNVQNACIIRIPKQPDFWSTSCDGVKTWVFCGSALSSTNLCYLVKFARCCGATVTRFWRPDVTHVITATDANSSCTRTLKVLMAILYGQWIISMDWIKSCAKANKPMNEEPYEVTLDNHGARDGPKTGRHLTLDNASTNLYYEKTKYITIRIMCIIDIIIQLRSGPKLFGSLIFYFSGDFDSGLMNDLKTLVLAAAGTIIENKEHLVSQTCVAEGTSKILIVYNADHTYHCTTGDEDSPVVEILETAENLALRIGSRIIQHTWILESIAACKLQPLPCYW